MDCKLLFVIALGSLLQINTVNTLLGNVITSKEYCIYDPFEAKCSGDDVIVMKSALYGFMGTGRCTKYDFGINCTLDVLKYLDEACSWKSECQYDKRTFDRLDSCLEAIRPYLIAEYACISVETSETCSASSTLNVSRPRGTLASAVAKQSGCGSMSIPWVIPLKEGQSVTVKLVDLLAKTNGVDDGKQDKCKPIGFISNLRTAENVTVCPSSPMSQNVYTTDKHGIKIQILTNAVSNFLLQYQVTGCMHLVAPEFAWYERSGDDAVIGCQYRNMTWHLHCDGNRWNGVVGRCNDTTKKSIPTQVESQTSSGYHYLIFIGVAALILIIIIISATVGILKLIDNKKRDTLKRQTLLDNHAPQEYSAQYSAQTMQMKTMYRDRAERVPDILENSLPRPHPMQYPESESSYGTNYPGTMYYMGAQNQQYQQQRAANYNNTLVNRSSDYYDTVTLPKKPPETVSDSDSEDMYATIPAYENP